MSAATDVQLRSSAAIAVAFALVTASAAAADEKRSWDLEFGSGVALAPNYDGANAASSRVRIWADGAYRTKEYGTFALDSGSLTVAPEARWGIVDSDAVGVGLLVGYRAGRDDRNPGSTSVDDGSSRLRGLPNVSGAADAGVGGHITAFGVPVFAQLRAALGGTQGTLVILGAYLPLEPAPDLVLTILPSLTWANARQMRALFGVSPSAAVASGFAAYTPRGGVQNAAIEIGADWHLSGGWHFIASMAFERLLGPANRSPIIQTANQPSVLAGFSLAF